MRRPSRWTQSAGSSSWSHGRLKVVGPAPLWRELLTVRSPIVVRILGLILAAGFLIAAFVGVAFTWGGLSEGRGAAGFTVASGFALWSALLWRMSIASVVLRPTELSIRNFFRSMHIPMSDVIDFRIGRGPVYPGALVQLASGEEIFLSAIQKSNFSWVLNRYSRADRLIAEMNEYVRRVRSGQGSG